MKRAFTLIELLVTIVLFSLLLVVALYSFRFASMDIKSINNTNPKEAINYYMIRCAINSIYPYVDIDKNQRDSIKAVHYFFDGRDNECYFITDRGLFFDNKIVLSHLYFKDNELWYEEGRIFGKDIDYKKLYKIPFLKKVLVLKNIDELKFFYTFSNKTYSEYKDKIPSSISIKFTKNKKIKKYYFFIGIDNQKRKDTVLQNREIF